MKQKLKSQLDIWKNEKGKNRNVLLVEIGNGEYQIILSESIGEQPDQDTFPGEFITVQQASGDTCQADLDAFATETKKIQDKIDDAG
ncbi:MAG: hypothetical protein WBB45_00090 [Cyclobacteriaceae bacterium]